MAVAECGSCGKKVVLRGGACALCGSQIVEAKQPSTLSRFLSSVREFYAHYKVVRHHRIAIEKSQASHVASQKSEGEVLEEAIVKAEERIARKKAGNGIGWASVVFAIIGIFMMGIVFIPIAAILSISGFFEAMGARNGTGEAINILGFFLSIVGFFTSPALMIAVGYASS